MNHLLLVFLFLAVIFTFVPEGLAGLSHAHRHHKRQDLRQRLTEDEYDLMPRYVGKVRRRSCRVRPSSSTNSSFATATAPPGNSTTQIISSSSLPTSSLVFSQAEGASFPSAIPLAPTSTIAPLVRQEPDPATTTSEEPAPSSSGDLETTSSIPSTASVLSPAATTASTSSSGSGSTSSSDIDQYLNDHNTVRAQYDAAALTWNDTLAAAAQQWANGCVFEHSGGKLGPYGENLAAGTGDDYGIDQAIKSWTDEASQYNAGNPVASHFTQVVWKATTQVGCAVQNCTGIFPASDGDAQYYVCEYLTQGNVIGEFAQNVQG